MTITTNLSPKLGKEEFSRRPATSKTETALTLAAGAAISLYGALRRDWFGAAFAGGGGYLLYCGIADLKRPYQGRVRVGFTIAKPPQEVYDFVRNTENWASGLRGIRFELAGDGGLTMRLGDGNGLALTSQIEVTDEKPGEYIAWASDAKMIEHRGVVHFKKAPGDRGTELSVALEYKAPTGPLSRVAAKFAGLDPEQLVREGIRQIKQLMEAGEIPTTAGQPVGARGLRGAAKRIMFREHPTVDMQPQRLAGD
ncbi:MAG TPA: SRPBCC family protein [Terriglobales bacterium]|nr:SRPBCC family protein [Terriglobales bacterium]